MIYLGADHRGFELKEAVKKYLLEQKIKFDDLGNTVFDAEDDWPDFAEKVAEKVQKTNGQGILFCGSGGMAIAANKFKGVWVVEAWNEATALHAKEHDKANVLFISADFVNEALANKMIKIWLEAKVKTEAKYQRRFDKIKQIEERNFI